MHLHRAMFIYNDDKEFFRKCREIQNKIIELIGINNPIAFVNADDDVDEFITADVHKNTSFVIEDNYRYGHNKVVMFYTLLLMIVLKHHQFNTDINKHKVKYIINACIPKLL